MYSDKRDFNDVETVRSGSSRGYAIAGIFMCATAALAYLIGDTLYNNYALNKSAFICTKIEQVGKNMDDVVCVQYTHQKFQKEAVALNKLNLVQ